MIQFTVYGTPTPQGSTRAFIPKGWKRPIITADNKKTKPWRQEIAGMARAAMSKRSIIPHGEAVTVEVQFFFDKPKSYSRKHKIEFDYKVTRPDIDKLGRAVLDALTGIIYEDDSQVCRLSLLKQYRSPARAEIRIIE